jgi:replicative DNA helicase
MVQPASEIVLSEVDVELTLLGTLFMSPGAFALMADEVQPEWFSDQFCRYMFEAALKIHQSGSHISPQAIVASLPEDCGGIPRGPFYARVCGSAMPANTIGGLVGTIRDRWARRHLVATAEALQARAKSFGDDPYDLAVEAVLSLDTVNANRRGKIAGSLDTGMDGLITALDQPAKLKGPSTGLQSLDTKLNGYNAGQLYVIAGRPGMGKSAFMCSSLRRTAEYGHGVAIFSLEMSAEEIAARCMADTLDTVKAPFFGSILKGLLSSADMDDVRMARDSLSGLPIYVEDSPRLTIAEITGKARRFKAECEAKGIRLAVVCIDHMGLVTPSDRYKGNKVAEAGEVSAAARALAKELDCCVVLLCQLSREVEKRDDKKPVMSDLRWSGEIEQDAHVVGFLYREGYYLANDPTAFPYQIQEARFNLDFLIRKNRNGETGDVRLWCSIGHSSVRDAI